MKKKKNVERNEAIKEELFKLFFKLLEDDRLPYELYAEYVEKIEAIIRGEKNCN